MQQDAFEFGKINPIEHERALNAAAQASMPFRDWLIANPRVWHEFCVLANTVRAKGRGRWSARAILHVLRWYRTVRDSGDEVFKINNNWSPEMARLYNRLHGITFFEERASPGEPFVRARERHSVVVVPA